MDIEAINILARQCGATTCRNRHSPDAFGMIFHPLEWQKFCKALAEQIAPAQPLTDEQREKLIKAVAESIDSPSIVMTHWPLVIDAVEAAHGITKGGE